MIPILFDKTETVFTSNGIGRLSDAESIVVTEERNGIFELEMSYPMTGIHFDDIEVDCYIKSVCNASGSTQLFRIYSITKPIDGRCTIYAEHVSYQMLHIPLMPFTALGAAATFASIPNYVVGDCPFTFYTNNTSNRRFTLKYPKTLRGALQGDQWSILQNFGGDYEWDNFTVRLLTRRGNDNGVVLRYGKNIIDLKQEENIQQTYTGIVPYWYGSEGEDQTLVILPEIVMYAETVDSFPYTRILPVDFTDQIETRPTVAELRAAGQTYIDRNEIGIPSVGISLDFVDLSQTEEYAGRAFERILLCDTVNVVFEELGVSKQARVTRTQYDVLRERYTGLYIGESYHSLSSIISDQTTAIKETAETSTTYMARAIEQATFVINGRTTGSVMKTLTDEDGNPQGWIVMDTEDESTAVNCIRCNINGIGFSTNGVNGPYTTAIYFDSILGEWVLNSNRLNVLNLNASNINTGVLSVNNGATEVFYADIDNGIVRISAGALAQTIGGRNYIRNSNTLDFIEYGFVWDFQYNGDQATLNGGNMEVIQR